MSDITRACTDPGGTVMITALFIIYIKIFDKRRIARMARDCKAQGGKS